MKSVALALTSLLFAATLSGCSASFDPALSGPAASKAAIQGRAFGGQQPIVGMQISLYAAGTGGYGTASKSLLTTAVTTDANGFFSIGGDYTCPTGATSYLYLYGSGGNAGGGINSAATLMAPLGPCAAGGNLATTVPYIWMNEVTTVVAAYTLAGWMTDPLHLATDNTTLAQNGLATAFAMAKQLEDISTGTPYATLPGLYSNGGTAPQATVNSLANILAACVNSRGASSNGCTGLFNNALNGGGTGAAPSDTASAVLNIAHNFPNQYGNATAIYNLSTAAAPFQPALTAAPLDWTLSVKLVTPNLFFNSVFPSIASDGQGNIGFVTTDGYGSSQVAFSNSGAGLGGQEGGIAQRGFAFSTSGTYVLDSDENNSGALDETNTSSDQGVASCSLLFEFGNGMPTVTQLPPMNAVAYTSNGTLWASSAATLFQFPGGVNSGCNNASTYTAGINAPSALAADASGNLWVANHAANNLLKVTAGGAITSNTNSAFSGISQVAVGSTGEAITTTNAQYLTTLSSTGDINFECNGDLKSALAVDGANVRWIVTQGHTLEYCSAGSSEAGTLFPPIDSNNTHAIAIDPAGNVWVFGSALTEVIGAATPPTLPLAAAAATNKIGTRP